MRGKPVIRLIATTAAAGLVALSGPMPATAAEPTPPTPEPEATGLADLILNDRPIAVPLPITGNVGLPGGLLGYDLDGPRTVLNGPGSTLKYGGQAVALHFDVHVSNILRLRSRKFGAVNVPTNNDGGRPFPSRIVSASGHEFLGPDTLQIRAGSSWTESECLRCKPTDTRLPEAEAHTKIAEVILPSLAADGIEVSAHTRQRANGEWETTPRVRFARLSINGETYEEDDIAPNTTYDLPGLGKIVLNEQTITRLPGDRYATKVVAIHISLDTADYGAPAGTDIYIGSAEALVYDN